MEKELNTTQEEFLEREIKLIVIHCSATRCNIPFTPARLEQAHKARGFHGTGYHFYITRDGVIHHTRPVDRIGAHSFGFNLHSIGICYEGGLSPEGKPQDTRTTFQRMALLDVLTILKKQYPKAK
ncbi:N-acetylmuramoyl-L-alanine amidase, partial [Phocaeicola sp.]